MPDTNDATIEEKVTPSESSTEEKTSNESDSNVSEDEQTQDKEDLGSGIKSYDDRFRQIYKQMKNGQRKIEELETKQVTKPAEQKPTEEFSPNTWDDVVEFVEKKQLAKSEIENKEIAKITQGLEKDMVEAKKLNLTTDEDKVWNYMAEKGIDNVFEAITKLNAEVNSSANKEVASKIGSRSQNVMGKSEISYEQLHNTSLEDLELPDN